MGSHCCSQDVEVCCCCCCCCEEDQDISQHHGNRYAGTSTQVPITAEPQSNERNYQSSVSIPSNQGASSGIERNQPTHQSKSNTVGPTSQDHDNSNSSYSEENYGASNSHKQTAQEMLWDRWRLKYVFDEMNQSKGVLRDEHGNRFTFNYYGSDIAANQERYEEIGKLTEEIVYELLEERGMLQRKYLHGKETGTFIFVSKNYKSCDKLLVLIHGSGAVRAGQWARRLIINDSTESGTQLPYIERAHSNGWAVLVMNTNDNYSYEGQRSPTDHGNYVWEKYVMPTKATEIAIVAHSAGGSVTASMVSNFTDDFIKRVVAIAFTDSFGSPQGHKAREHFEKVTINWVTSIKPVGTGLPGRGVRCKSAGTTKHEETSHYAIDDIFQYFDEKFRTAKKQKQTENAKETRKSASTAGGSNIVRPGVEQYETQSQNCEYVSSGANAEERNLIDLDPVTQQAAGTEYNKGEQSDEDQKQQQGLNEVEQEFDTFAETRCSEKDTSSTEQKDIAAIDDGKVRTVQQTGVEGVTKPKEEICTENKPTQLGDGETSATEGETNARVVKLADIKLEQLTSESESGSTQLQQQKLGDTQTQAQGATVSTADNDGKGRIGSGKRVGSKEIVGVHAAMATTVSDTPNQELKSSDATVGDKNEESPQVNEGSAPKVEVKTESDGVKSEIQNDVGRDEDGYPNNEVEREGDTAQSERQTSERVSDTPNQELKSSDATVGDKNEESPQVNDGSAPKVEVKTESDGVKSEIQNDVGRDEDGYPNNEVEREGDTAQSEGQTSERDNNRTPVVQDVPAEKCGEAFGIEKHAAGTDNENTVEPENGTIENQSELTVTKTVDIQSEVQVQDLNSADKDGKGDTVSKENIVCGKRAEEPVAETTDDVTKEYGKGDDEN